MKLSQVEAQGLWLILITTFQVIGWAVYSITYYRYRMSLRRVSGLEEGLGNLKGAKIEKPSK